MVAGPQPQLRVPSAAQFLLTILAQSLLHISLQLGPSSLSAIGHSIADIGTAIVYSGSQ
jgi:hypothetical protein